MEAAALLAEVLRRPPRLLMYAGFFVFQGNSASVYRLLLVRVVDDDKLVGVPHIQGSLLP